MTDLLQIIPSVVGGGFVGSIATHYLTTGRERREIRSVALAKLTDVEDTRWAGEHNRDTFTTALRELETAALIAQLPRDLVLLYKLFAQTARNLSESDIEDDPMQHPEDAGTFDPQFTTLVRDTAAVMSRAIWSPMTTRVTVRRAIKTLERRALSAEKEYVRINLGGLVSYFDYHWHIRPHPEKSYRDPGNLPGQTLLPHSWPDLVSQSSWSPGR